MNPEAVKKILVIRFSSLGDILLTSPLLNKISKKYPNAEIHYLTKRDFSDVIRYHPKVAKVIEAGGDIDFSGLRQLKKALKLTGYDLIIDAHNNLRSRYLRLFMGKKKLVFKKYSLRKFLLVKFKINLMKELPSISQRYCDIIAGEDPPLLPEIYTDVNARRDAENLIKELNLSPDNKLICIAPSSNHFTKTYPPEYYIELINKFDSDKYNFLLVGKGKDCKNINEIKSKTGNNVIDLCDKLTVLELAELIKRCDLFISGDTGPMHVAEALEKNLIMLAGSSVKEFGFYPQNKNAVVFENNTLKCRPCSHIGMDECPLGHFRCMRELTPELIFEKINRVVLPPVNSS